MATAVPTNVKIDHEAGTDRSLFAIWTWTKSNTDHYEVWWEYSTANKGVWFTGSESSENHNMSTYSYPDNAVSVRFRVKPVAKNKSGSDTPYWISAWTATVSYSVPKSEAVKAKQYIDPPSDLKLKLEAGTDRTYHAQWTWKWANTDYVIARWMYYTANKEWFFGPIEEISSEQITEDGLCDSAYSVPTNALKVRCQVHPVSTIAYETDETIVYYWSAPWSEWTNKTLPTEGSTVISDAPTKPVLDIQNGTDRTLYATWKWDKSKTDHYFVHWQYATGDMADGKLVWFEGTTTNVTVKNVTYSAPDNATRVRVWVKAYAQEGATWSESATSAVGYYNDFVADEAGAIAGSKIKVARERQNDSTLVASWVSDASNFEYEWYWSAGDQNASKEYIYHNSSGSPTATTEKSATYSPPSNTTRVQFRVRALPGGPWSKKISFKYSEQLKTASKSTKTVKFSQPIILEEGTDRNLIAQWEWAESNTASYNVSWQYSTGQGIWFYGKRNESVDHLYDTYTAPTNATRVRFYVRPIAATKKVQGIDTPYWTAETSKVIYYSFIDTGEPEKATVPAVTLDELKLTAELDIYDTLADVVEFEVVKNDSKTFKVLRSKVTTNHAAVSCTVDIGGEYKVRARAINAVQKTSISSVLNDDTNAVVERGEWSEYSANVGTIPAAPEEILWHKATQETEIQIGWAKVSNVTGYKIEYATNKEYFDASDQTTTVDVAGTGTTYFISGLEPGQTYFFRVCAVNDAGQSAWTPNYHDDQSYPVVLGTRPNAPTTWSDTTSGVIGENLCFYWTHNSEDESAQSDAEVELTINGTTITVEPTYMSDGSLPSYYVFNTNDQFENINVNTSTVDDSVDDTLLDDSGEEINGTTVRDDARFEGAVIVWRVRTKGIVDEWSPYSAARTVIIYVQPTLDLYVGNNSEHNDKLYELTRYPLLIYAEAFPATQNAIGFDVSITANESYETRDRQGNRMSVRDQEAVFEQYYPASNGNVLDISLDAGDISLDNDITYTVSVTASMDSSLVAENNWTFIARWTVDVLVPDAEVTVNTDTLSAYIRPFCNDEDGDLIDDVYLAVYRIEYDGRLVKLADGLRNGEITITDPHPSLNYARYRVVATYKATGIMGFRDIPGVFVGETGIVVQWGEEWNSFFTADGEYQDPMDETVDQGSILKLPYNIEVSDSNDMDVALNEYIGRAHPVSYYGTQLGVKGSWQGVIRRDDVETIYALRRLAVYRGDVYVREPSGVGYWANINVSFSKRYNEMTIPVSLNVVRVEGGI